MVDPFPSRPNVAKVSAYIPLTTPPPALNPPPYTGQGQHHTNDPESGAGDPFITHKPTTYTGYQFSHRPLPSHYVQRCGGHHVAERWSKTRTIMLCISIAFMICGIIAIVMRLNRDNNN